jgi:hypothetical protein
MTAFDSVQSICSVVSSAGLPGNKTPCHVEFGLRLVSKSETGVFSTVFQIASSPTANNFRSDHIQIIPNSKLDLP